MLSARRKQIHWAGRFGVCNFGAFEFACRESRELWGGIETLVRFCCCNRSKRHLCLLKAYRGTLSLRGAEANPTCFCSKSLQFERPNLEVEHISAQSQYLELRLARDWNVHNLHPKSRCSCGQCYIIWNIIQMHISFLKSLHCTGCEANPF